MQAVETALQKNALQPVLLDVTGMASYTDHILILSGRSVRQVEAIAEAVAHGMKSIRCDVQGREGEKKGQWALLDFGDLVVHIFYHPLREYYDIEGLWSEAEKVKLEVPPELRFADAYGYVG